MNRKCLLFLLIQFIFLLLSSCSHNVSPITPSPPATPSAPEERAPLSVTFLSAVSQRTDADASEESVPQVSVSLADVEFHSDSTAMTLLIHNHTESSVLFGESYEFFFRQQEDLPWGESQTNGQVFSDVGFPVPPGQTQAAVHFWPESELPPGFYQLRKQVYCPESRLSWLLTVDFSVSQTPVNDQTTDSVNFISTSVRNDAQSFHGTSSGYELLWEEERVPDVFMKLTDSDYLTVQIRNASSRELRISTPLRLFFRKDGVWVETPLPAPFSEQSFDPIYPGRGSAVCLNPVGNRLPPGVYSVQCSLSTGDQQEADRTVWVLSVEFEIN